jgi:hypothetical protein
VLAIENERAPLSPLASTGVTESAEPQTSPAPARTDAQWEQITDAFRDLGPSVECRMQLALDPAKVSPSVDADGRRYYENALQSIDAMLQDGTLTFDATTKSLVAANNLVALQRFIPGAVVWPVASKWIAAVGFSFLPPEFEIELTVAGTTAYENLLGAAGGAIGAGLQALGLPAWAAGPMGQLPAALVKAAHALSAKNAVKLSFFPTPPAGFICIPEPA